MTYQLLLTTLGQQKLASAASAGGQPLRITEFAIGQGVNVDFSKRLDQQVLVSKRYQGNVESVTSTAVAGQYEITCIVPQDQGGWTIREIGLIDSAGDLIWVGQVPEVQKPIASSTAAVDYRIKAVISIDNPDVNLVIDANVVTATQAWVANNFVSNPRFAQFLDLAFPFGYPYWSHSKANPKPLFDAMFGFETHWRRLEGVGLIAVKDGDAYIGQPMLTLGQVGNTELATTGRPHTYPIHTSYLFERYDPSTVVETVWKVAANKTPINEGEAVRFTVTANNVPDGQILNWSAKEGALNSSSNDISSPEKTDNGTVILKNGQAIINFTTTSDDNETEPQKHVRLVVGAPANLSLNIPINDAGHNETVMHISQSTTNGIDLAEYYKVQSGSYPSSDDIVRFIVDEGVDIIAPNTDTPALIEGANWPVAATPIVENHGRILGRGGDGGLGAVLIRAAKYESKLAYSDTAKKGGDGGTAIQSTTRPILIENYNLIAGGGGGGGGGGAYVYDFSSSDQRVGHQNGTAAGGGAPLGKASINAGSFEWYMADDRNDNRALVAANMDVNNPFPAFAGLTFSGTTIANAVMNLDSLYFNGRIVIDEPANLRGDFKDMPLWIPSMRKAVENSSLYNKYKSQIENDPDDRVFFQKVWPDSDSEIYNLSTVCKRATDASVSSAGLGGYSVGAYNDTRGVYQGDDGGDLSVNSGGSGGAFGENGQTFVLAKYLLLDNVNDTNSIAPKAIDKSQLSSSRAHELAPAKGGLAGYIKEGNVTITNYSGGVTKGR